VDITALIKKSDGSGKKALSESEAKQLLKIYDIPVIEEKDAKTEDEAVSIARDIGFPVVLKGLGSTLLHKTERGLVHLNLADEHALISAARKIKDEAGDELEGLLVQPQIQGRREFVAGMFRDPLFGPVIMFGVGGIFTEAFTDVVFRLAPLNEKDASAMLAEINAQALLGAFRGEMAAETSMLIQTLLGISKLALEHPQIAEIDINPLIITPEGSPFAVDALVVLGQKPEEKEFSPSVEPIAIRDLFYPESIAFVGATGNIGKWGHMLLTNTISGGYEGEIYLVNPKGEDIVGRKVYKSVLEIPGKVDLGVVTIPAAMVLDLIPEFERKGIRNMLLITSGFGETGEKGKQLEKKLVEKARKAGILILGPNTMGICNPHINFYCTGSPVQPMSGSTAMVTQSGNMGVQLLAFAEEQAIGIRGFCGSGNEAMMTVEDFLDGFEVDELTSIVMLYVESVKNGHRFFESARRVGCKKPIVLMKGGQSKVGNRAAASHTGAMSSDAKVFNAVCRQAGIVKVEQSMDLLDLSAAFSSLPLPKGNRAAIMTLGGGWGVVTADLCSQFDLEVPDLSTQVLKNIDGILPPYWSRANPVDIVGESDLLIPIKTIEELVKWDGCDAVINLGIMGRRLFAARLAESAYKTDPKYSKDLREFAGELMQDFEMQYIKHIVKLMEKYKKPVYGVSLITDENDQTVYPVDGYTYKCIFYQTPERAVKAFAKMYEYYQFLNR